MDTNIAETLEQDHLHHLIRALSQSCSLPQVVEQLNKLSDFLGADPFDHLVTHAMVPKYGRFKTYTPHELPGDIPTDQIFSWDDSHAVMRAGGCYYKIPWGDVPSRTESNFGFRR